MKGEGECNWENVRVERVEERWDEGEWKEERERGSESRIREGKRCGGIGEGRRKVLE